MKCPNCKEEIENLNWSGDVVIPISGFLFEDDEVSIAPDSIGLDSIDYENITFDDFRCPNCDEVVATHKAEADRFLTEKDYKYLTVSGTMEEAIDRDNDKWAYGESTDEDFCNVCAEQIDGKCWRSVKDPSIVLCPKHVKFLDSTNLLNSWWYGGK